MDRMRRQMRTRLNEPEMIELWSASIQANRVGRWIGTVRTTLSVLLAAAGVVAVGSPSLRTPLVVSAAVWSVILLASVRPLAIRHTVRASLVQELFDTELFGLPWNFAYAPHQPQPSDVRRLAGQVGQRARGRASNRYVDTTGIPQPYGVLVCQLRNLGWDGRLRRRWAALLAAATLGWIGCGIVLGLALRLDVLTLLLAWYLPGLPALVLAAEGFVAHRGVAARRGRIAEAVRRELENAGPGATIAPAERDRLTVFARAVQDIVLTTRQAPFRVPRWYHRARLASDESDFGALATRLRNRFGDGFGHASVVVNYRSPDAADAAARLDDELSHRLGRSAVFLDHRSIEPGTPVDDELVGRAADCDLLLVVVGPSWETVTGLDGRRCLDDPKDWVRREIVAASGGPARIVPILVGARARLRERELPAALAEVAHLRYLHLPNGFDNHDVAHIVDALLNLIDSGRVSDPG